jgi:hypothetical protein
MLKVLHCDKTFGKGRSGFRRWLYDCLHCIHEHLRSLDLRLVLDCAGKSHSHSRVQYDQYIQEVPRMWLWISLSVHSTPLPFLACISIPLQTARLIIAFLDIRLHSYRVTHQPLRIQLSRWSFASLPSQVSHARSLTHFAHLSWWACGGHGKRCRFNPCSPNKVAHILFRPVLPRGFSISCGTATVESAVAQCLVGYRSIIAGYEAIIPLPAKPRLVSPVR